MATVKVVQVPGGVKTVTVGTGATAQDAINAAGITLAGGETIKVNGLEAKTSTFVNDGDSVLLAKGAKGN